MTSLVVAKFGIDLSVFVAGNLDEIVPVHDRSYLVFEAVGLFDFLVGRDHHSLILDLLTRSFCAVIQE